MQRCAGRMGRPAAAAAEYDAAKWLQLQQQACICSYAADQVAAAAAPLVAVLSMQRVAWTADPCQQGSECGARCRAPHGAGRGQPPEPPTLCSQRLTDALAAATEVGAASSPAALLLQRYPPMWSALTAIAPASGCPCRMRPCRGEWPHASVADGRGQHACGGGGGAKVPQGEGGALKQGRGMSRGRRGVPLLNCLRDHYVYAAIWAISTTSPALHP